METSGDQVTMRTPLSSAAPVRACIAALIGASAACATGATGVVEGEPPTRPVQSAPPSPGADLSGPASTTAVDDTVEPSSAAEAEADPIPVETPPEAPGGDAGAQQQDAAPPSTQGPADLPTCFDAARDPEADCQCDADDRDRDGDGVPDCADACEKDATGFREEAWYPDCDEDGEFSSLPIMACGRKAADKAFRCDNGKKPRGGWSTTAGLDCADEDHEITFAKGYHADCDGDGEFQKLPVVVCNIDALDSQSPCLGAAPPLGGWSEAAGVDCNDDDPATTSLTDWYADCDADGVFGSDAVRACGGLGANLASPCAKAAPPAGGWSNTGGDDCDDNDPRAGVLTGWFADCDGDAVFSSSATPFCGQEPAPGAWPCARGLPMGGWSLQSGRDCHDEDDTRRCACDEQDLDRDGICSPVDSLRSARGVATSVVSFELSDREVSAFVDGDFQQGGWVLIGRGREGWQWSEAALGDPADVASNLATPAAFSPRYLSAEIVQALIDNAGLALTEIEVRIRRAADPGGQSFQETLWRPLEDGSWTWDLPGAALPVRHVVGPSVLGDGLNESADTFDAGGDDHTRVFTWRWKSRGAVAGFAYGVTVSSGSQAQDSFLWQQSEEGHAIPYTEVYVRAAPRESCLAVLRSNPSAVDGRFVLDPDGTGEQPPFQAQCDMSNGGWTVLAHHDFEDGASRGWRSSTGDATAVDSDSDCAGTYSAMLRSLAHPAAPPDMLRTFALAGVPHEEAWVTLDYVVLDSWDRELASVEVDGEEVYRQSFHHGEAARAQCGGHWRDHGPQPVAHLGYHTADTLSIRVSAGLDSGAADESFGLDNVRVRVR